MPVKETRASSAVDRVAYNAAKRALSVWFKGGRRYIYSGVPPELYDALCDAPSIGSFVNAAIKGCFPCRSEPPRRFFYD